MPQTADEALLLPAVNAYRPITHDVEHLRSRAENLARKGVVNALTLARGRTGPQRVHRTTTRSPVLVTGEHQPCPVRPQ